MNKCKLSDKIYYLICAITFFRLPSIVEYKPYFSGLYTLLEIFCGIVIILKIIKNNYFPKVIVYELIFFLIFLISSILNRCDIIETIHLIYKTLIFSLILDYGFKSNSKEVSKIFFIYLFILIIINFLSIIIYPSGMYTNSTGYSHNWILGYKNNHIIYIIFSLLFYVIYKNKKSNIFLFLYTLICLIFIFIIDSSTSIIGLLLILILLPLSKKIKIRFDKFLIVFIGIFLSIVIFRIQNIFDFLIVDILHKNLTFTGRIFIWDDVIELIKLKPIFGYGNTLYKYGLSIYTTHNQVLDLIYKTGISGLMMFSIFISICSKNMIKYKNYNITKVITIIIFSFLIMGIQEAYSLFYVIILFLICYDINYLIDKKEGV